MTYDIKFNTYDCVTSTLDATTMSPYNDVTVQ